METSISETKLILRDDHALPCSWHMRDMCNMLIGAWFKEVLYTSLKT